VRDRISRVPLDVDFARSGIDLDAAGDRVAERIGERHPIGAEYVHRGTERLPAVVGRRHVDLADGEVVVDDVNLILVRRQLAWVDGQPGAIDEAWADRGHVVLCPGGPAIITKRKMRLKE